MEEENKMKLIPQLDVTEKDREIAEYISREGCAEVDCLGGYGLYKGITCPLYKDHIRENYNCEWIVEEAAKQFLDEQFLSEGKRKENLLFTSTIEGHPVVLKNNKKICRTNSGRTFIKSNDIVDAWMQRAIWFLKSETPQRICCDMQIKFTFFGAWKKGGGNVPDLSNLYQAPEDALERAGVIENDRLIESHDGSRRVYMCDTCELRPIIKSGKNKGERKKDCGHIRQCQKERVMIEIYEFK